MDIEDLLPFLFVIATFIFGLFRKKKNSNTQETNAPRPSVFEDLLEELGGNKEQPVYNEYEDEFGQEQAVQSITEPVLASQKATTKSRLDSYDFSKYNSLTSEGSSGIKRKSSDSLEIVDLDEDMAFSIDIDLSDPDEQRKAVIYSEVLKPIYF